MAYSMMNHAKLEYSTYTWYVCFYTFSIYTYTFPYLSLIAAEVADAATAEMICTDL